MTRNSGFSRICGNKRPAQANKSQPPCKCDDRYPVVNSEHSITGNPKSVALQFTPDTFVRYFLSFLLPPVAVLLCGKPFMALLNLVLTLLGWIPGIIHALLVVNDHKSDLRAYRFRNSRCSA